MYNSSSEAGETVNIYTIFPYREFNPRQSVRGDPDCVVACVIVSLRRRHSRYQHDRNNIMITSRVLYKHSHTPPAPAGSALAAWPPRTGPWLREKSKHDSRIHKASNPCSSIIWSEGEAKKYFLRDGGPSTEKFSWIKKNLVQSVFVQKSEVAQHLIP